jgi:hypothetical protein
MDKTTLSFQCVIEIDNETKISKTTMIIDTTTNGSTIKRKHIFDQKNQFTSFKKDDQFKPNQDLAYCNPLFYY